MRLSGEIAPIGGGANGVGAATAWRFAAGDAKVMRGDLQEIKVAAPAR